MRSQNTALRITHARSDLLTSSVLITVVLIVRVASVRGNGNATAPPAVVRVVISTIQRHLRGSEMTGSPVGGTLLLLLLLSVIISLVFISLVNIIIIWMIIGLNLMVVDVVWLMLV